MDKKTEALKLALEALEECRRDPRLKYEHPYYDKTITAIREALAEQCVCGEPDTPGTHRTDGPCLAEQPAQKWTDETAKVPDHVWVTPKLRPLAKMAHEKKEPVAWLCMTDQYSKIVRFEWETFGNVTPLYKSPPASNPLTNDKYEAIVEDIADWNRYVEVDTAHQSLEKHVREVLTAHGIKENT